MFRTSAYPDDPETKKYGLWMHGIPMFYAGPTKTDLKISWDRRLADTRKPGWRAYLLKKAEMAVDAGVDAIVWYNMIVYDDGRPSCSMIPNGWRCARDGRAAGPRSWSMPTSICRRTGLG